MLVIPKITIAHEDGLRRLLYVRRINDHIKVSFRWPWER